MKQVPPTGGAASWAAMALMAAAMWNSTMPWSAARRSGQSLAWGAARRRALPPPQEGMGRVRATIARRLRTLAGSTAASSPILPPSMSDGPAGTTSPTPPAWTATTSEPAWSPPGWQARASTPVSLRVAGRIWITAPMLASPAVASAMVALSDLTLRPVVPVSRCHQGLDCRALPRALQAPGSRRPVGPFRGSPRELVERGRTPRRPFSLRGGQPGCWSGCASPESTPHGTRATGPA